MNDFIPMNKLDRTIKVMQRSRAGFPDFCRELSTGELWFLVPFHPEVEGETLELKNGSQLPFAMLQDQAGEVVPVFSSEARLQEGLEKGAGAGAKVFSRFTASDPVAGDFRQVGSARGGQ